ncbi:MAG: FAD-dependent thymidylate synthase [Chitinophagaceae bacterium]|nr:FAD-dependent thymidylate synthase [Chitinophagaceae bacterium]
MKILNNSEVTYLDHMGSDLSVVNAARVSFNKTSIALSDKDEKLIGYLARHNHWTPFAHTSVSLRVKAPIFVARQLVKHCVGGVWNEVSRRYVDDEPEFYFPKVWRKKAENVKQGSSEEAFEFNLEQWSAIDQAFVRLNFEYKNLISKGVCAEQARMLLPQNTMTEWIWTGSLAFFARVCKLRLDAHTQKETRDVAEQIEAIVSKLFPVSYKALMEHNE